MPEAILSTGPSNGQIAYVNNVGEAGVYDARAPIPSLTPLVVQTWATKLNKWHSVWCDDEGRQRAGFIGTRRLLSKYLIPHRFEGTMGRPENLRRAQLGYSIGLNSAYLDEIFGHIRSAPAHYFWGALGAPKTADYGGDNDIQTDPKGPRALRFWEDVTGDGMTWEEFFPGKTLEWILSSPGCVIIVDSNKPPGTGRITQGEADRQGYRPTLKLVPFSAVEDIGMGPRGVRWIKIAEEQDKTSVEDEPGKENIVVTHAIYELMPDGSTRIRRVDDEGNAVGDSAIQVIKDMDGQGMLPLLIAKFGEHPEIYYLGSGLLMGLDDIVIDIFNLITETREAYRDAVFNFVAYTGSSFDQVYSQLQSGSRAVNLGAVGTETLKMVGGEGGEVASGLQLIDNAIQNWALSATRRAIESVQGQTGNAKSGNALKTEFQLDLAPLMVSITKTLDKIETGVMFILGQIAGLTPEQANLLKVSREAEFQMEEEASRIARIVDEFKKAIPGMPAILLKEMIMRWAKSLKWVDMEKVVDGGKTVGQILETQAKEVADQDQEARRQANEFGILGVAARGAVAGGSNNGGGRPRPQRSRPRPQNTNGG